MNNSQTEATREKLLLAARSQFAARGFYGASIAQIAGELDLTKQALLYHFKRKEDLYAEVLRSISQRLQTAMQAHVDAASSPEQQLEDMVLGIHDAAQKSPLDAKVLMRELLDNQRSETPPEEQYLKLFLNAITARLDAIEGMAQRPFAEKLAAIYLIIASIEFFAASGQVLERFYGAQEYEAIRASYHDQLREHVQRLIAGASGA